MRSVVSPVDRSQCDHHMYFWWQAVSYVHAVQPRIPGQGPGSMSSHSSQGQEGSRLKLPQGCLLVGVTPAWSLGDTYVNEVLA